MFLFYEDKKIQGKCDQCGYLCSNCESIKDRGQHRIFSIVLFPFIVIIKELLGNKEGVTYLGNSTFSVVRTSTDLKKADHEVTEMLEEISKKASRDDCTFVLKK